MSTTILFDKDDEKHKHFIAFDKNLATDAVAMWKRFGEELRYDYARYCNNFHDFYSKNPEEILQHYNEIANNMEIPLTQDPYYKKFRDGMRMIFPEGNDAQHFLMYLLTGCLSSWDLEIRENGIQCNITRQNIDKSEISSQVAFFKYVVENDLFARIYPQYSFEPQIVKGITKTYYYSEMEKRVMELTINEAGVALSHYNLKPVKKILAFVDNFGKNNNEGLGLGINQEYLLKLLDYHQLQHTLPVAEKKNPKVKI